jgi:hypothetical protein
MFQPAGVFFPRRILFYCPRIVIYYDSSKPYRSRPRECSHLRDVRAAIGTSVSERLAVQAARPATGAKSTRRAGRHDLAELGSSGLSDVVISESSSTGNSAPGAPPRRNRAAGSRPPSLMTGPSSTRQERRTDVRGSRSSSSTGARPRLVGSKRKKDEHKHPFVMASKNAGRTSRLVRRREQAHDLVDSSSSRGSSSSSTSTSTSTSTSSNRPAASKQQQQQQQQRSNPPPSLEATFLC